MLFLTTVALFAEHYRTEAGSVLSDGTLIRQKDNPRSMRKAHLLLWEGDHTVLIGTVLLGMDAE